MFPPSNAVGAVRTGKTAKYFVESGHEVKVISCANQTFVNSLPLEVSEKNIEYTPHSEFLY